MTIHFDALKSDGLSGWRTSHALDGILTKSMEYEESTDPEKDYFRSYLYDESNELVSYEEHVYDDYGLREINTHAPDGSLINRGYQE